MDIAITNPSGGDRIPVRLVVRADADSRAIHWVMERKDLGIAVTDRDYEKCLRDFKDEFLFVWNEYGKADDLTLTSGGLELKRKMISLVLGS